ncbi:MAG TPA: alpha/beta hydrolase [Stellaceae bacterium]|nr:alpha/beta hydrolase [Stellaceae bacterium]
MSITHHHITANGIKLHLAEAGEGPLVIFCHGWPESWYSWRHQLPALAEAGFHAVAPDMRGYGESDAPEAIEAYSLLHLVGDMVGLVEALGQKEAIIVGHDWGAPVAWSAALLRPDLFRKVAAMSVPHRRRAPARPLEILRKAGLHTYYWIYFQEPGVAEAEFERDVAATMRRILYTGSGDAPAEQKLGLTLKPGAGFLDSTLDPKALPPWLKAEDLAFMVKEFRRTGFRGGLNWYRNIDRNWELFAPWQGAKIRQPALFIAGTEDAVIKSTMGQTSLQQMVEEVPGLKRTLLLPGAGHWIQQERPAEVNEALIAFIKAAAD